MRDKINKFIGSKIMQPIANIMVDIYADMVFIFGVDHNISMRLYGNALLFDYIVEYYFKYELE